MSVKKKRKEKIPSDKDQSLDRLKNLDLFLAVDRIAEENEQPGERKRQPERGKRAASTN